MERQSLDNQLFSWQDALDEGPFAMQFIDVELKVAIGPYSIGTQFPFAFIMGDSSLLVLVDDADEEHAFELKMTVGEAVEDDPEEECGEGCTHHIN